MRLFRYLFKYSIDYKFSEMSVNKSHNWKSSYHSIFDQKLQDIKNEGHYRYFNEIERKAGGDSGRGVCIGE